METLKKLFAKKAPPRPEAAEEVPIMETEVAARPRMVGELEPIYVKSMTLQSLADVRGVSDELRVGNIVILDIAPLMDRDPADLKRAVDQLRGICEGIGGDIGRLTESRVIATPRFVRIHFKKEAA